MQIRAAGAQAVRVRVNAYIGTKVRAEFRVDVVADGVHTTGEPDQVSPLTSVEVLDRERVTWRAYPLIDHVADKTCAIVSGTMDGRRRGSRT